MTGWKPRALGLACAAALAGCTSAPRPLPPTAIAAAGPVCRVGPDGGPLIAERGIGGTGAPATQVAERGIGGTGIIGVVTGFASICLAGHEVALPADVPIEIGGAAADQRALRAGQVAAVEADGPADALYARRVMVRYEVQGPIEAVGPDRLQVAGQTVLLSAETWLRTAPAVGQWVAVSGLRDATGAIAATRLDLVSTRTVIVHGVVQQREGGYRIGGLPVVPGPGDVLVPGLPVSVTGVYNQGEARAASVAPDLLAADPVAYFGGYTSNFIFEGFASPAERGPLFGTLQVPASSAPTGRGRSVVEFRRAGGGIRVEPVAAGGGGRSGFGPPSGLQQAPTTSREGSGRGGDRAFEPAPTPNRSLGFGPASDRSGGASGAGRFGDGSGRGPGFRSPPGGDGSTAGQPGPQMFDGSGRRR